ncbi:MAG TPA: hypothetical protein VG755_04295, partial [Nannocystaceae bacterium]|nr:hypothetical protein [Nannocystaceae bacterium]
MHESITDRDPAGVMTGAFVGPHPADCNLTLDRLVIAQRARARLFGKPQPAVRVGRYVMLDRLGAGGMGMVFSAYDETLD